MSTDGQLVQIDKINIAALFGEDLATADSILAGARTLATQEVFDMGTKKGRDACASMAHRVARSKTAVEAIGKEHVADLKAQTKAVDATRKYLRDHFDTLKSEVRAPLDEFEAAQALEEAAFNELVDSAKALSQIEFGATVDSIRVRLASAKALDTTALAERFQDAAASAQLASIKAIEPVLEQAEEAARLEAEREAAEVARIAAEKETEAARIEAEKAEREKREAEAAAERERLAAELAKEKAARAEADAQAEAERKQREEAEAKEAAAKREADEAAAAAAREKAEAERLAADREHRGATHSAIANHLTVEHGLTEEQAKAIVCDLVKGRVPNVRINYAGEL